MWFENLSSSKILQELAIKIYQPPISTLIIQNAKYLPEILQDTIFFLEFDTEVSMGGVDQYLQSFSGRFFAETIRMFEKIDASETVQILKSVEQIMLRHNISYSDLRGDFEGHSEYEIITSSELHGANASKMLKEIVQASSNLYLNRSGGEQTYLLFEKYLANRHFDLIDSLKTIYE